MPLLSNRKTRWVFLSPHLDDAVYSCGGLIAYLSGNGIRVEIWTVFSEQEKDESRITDYARSLHKRWAAGDQPYIIRKEEDKAACQTTGAESLYLGFKDCIYRTIPVSGHPIVTSDAELFGTANPEEDPLVREISRVLIENMTEPSVWVCPLGLGNHIDHQIVRRAAEATRKLMLFYADLPYGLELPVQSIPGLIQLSINLPQSAVQMWGKANLQYASQLSSFWKNAADMASQYSSFLERYKGMPLWLPSPKN
ncbi:MAG: PIG-L family deacetylase [Leptolinea sp.]|nr:PIG-L family deacetylase [Leptolinea sp.]